MADKVTSVLVYVLGERDFPLAPVVKLRGGVTDTLGDIMAEALRRMPGTSYEDVLRLLLAIGLTQIGPIFEAGGRIEAGGKITFAPVQEGRKMARSAALQAKLLEAGVLQSVLLGDRPALPEMRKPVNTIPVPPAPPAPPAPPESETDEQREAKLIAGQEASLP